MGGTEGRIDVFDAEGLFLTEVLIPDSPYTIAVDSQGVLYVLELPGDSPGKLSRYEPETYDPAIGDIQYPASGEVVVDDPEVNPGAGIAVDLHNDHLYFNYGDRIVEYSSAMADNQPLDIIGEGVLKHSKFVAIDHQSGKLYATYWQEPEVPGAPTPSKVVVFELSSPHALLATISEADGKPFKTEVGWLQLAVNEHTGHLFVGDIKGAERVFELDDSYEYVSTIEHSFVDANRSAIAVDNSGGVSQGYLFVSSGFNGIGHSYAFAPIEVIEAPLVESVSVAEIAESEAQLSATINPNGAETSYAFQYVTQQSFEESGFDSAVLAAGGQIPTGSEGVEVAAPVTGLAPGTAYRFRVVAENDCDVSNCADEAEAGFTTYPAAEAAAPCPNDALRVGPSAPLPDCRAYELVTPSDTNGRAPRGVGFVGARFPTFAASPTGDRVSFLTEGGAIPGTDGAGGFNGDRYLAARSASGWGTTIAGPSGNESELPNPGSASLDQGYSFWETGGALDGGSAVIDGNGTAYVRYPDGSSKLVGRGSLDDDPRAKGNYIAPGGSHIVFTSSVELEPDAPPSGTEAVYDLTADGITHVVSVLPGNLPLADGEDAQYVAASADGSGVAFSVGTDLYLRHDNAETFEIGDESLFAGLTEDGNRIFYVEDGDLYAFDVTSGKTVPFSSSGDVTVVNVAGEGARAYLVSPSVLTEEPGPGGAAPQAGKENLYLSEEGAFSFVGTVTQLDVEGEDRGNGLIVGLGRWASAVGSGRLSEDPSRATPDGSVLLFESRAQLTAAPTGGHIQVYRYDASSARLHCLSCLPSAQESGSDASLQSIAVAQDSPAPASSYGVVANLRPDGRRAFFQSSEPLVVRDTDGLQDVYEWEEQGVGSCKLAGGCVSLISSGHSARDDYLYAASELGDDVFFITADVLTSTDANATPSIYDARVNGGFPGAPAAGCLPEECRGQLSPPALLPRPPSSAVGPSGNIQKPRARKCPKGKRKVMRRGKVRCVKKHQRHRAARNGAAR